MNWLMKWLDDLSRPTSLMLGFSVSLLLAALHFFWGYQLAFSPFYLLSILLVAWHNRFGPIVVISAFDALLWQGTNLLAGETLAEVMVLLWNAFTRFLFFSIIGFLIYRLRESIRAERALSRRDFLTGALNRRAFDEYLKHVNERPKDYQNLSLAFFDIDHFKRLNDSLGHDIGDEALVVLTKIVQGYLDEQSRFVRLGGDEFCLVSTNSELGDTKKTLDLVESDFAKYCTEKSWGISLSIGLVQSNLPIENPIDLIRSADEAMYQAKNEQ